MAGEKPRSWDADLGRMFLFGCGVLFGLFLCGWVVIFLFWMS